MDAGVKAVEACELLEKRYGRGMPWKTRSAVDALVGVILSQNTSDVLSWRAFRSLKDKFKSWNAVANAPASKIAAAIKIGGLPNIKAKRIKSALIGIKKRRGRLSLDFLAETPTSEAKAFLTSLHGVGPKSAAVVLNFCFGRFLFPVDVHVFRVSKRLGIVPEKATREKAHETMDSLVPDRDKQSCHINMIRLGREVCIARKPRCWICPLQKICDYYADAGKYLAPLE